MHKIITRNAAIKPTMTTAMTAYSISTTQTTEDTEVRWYTVGLMKKFNKTHDDYSSDGITNLYNTDNRIQYQL